MTATTHEDPAPTTGLVISTPRWYDLRRWLHTRGREGRHTAHAPSGHRPGHAGFDLDRVAMFLDHLNLEALASGPIEFRLTYLEDLRYVLAR